MSKLYIVMPAYNEAENIGDTVSKWYTIVSLIHEKGTECKLVIANDGSKDETYQILEDLKKTRPHLIALNKNNSGHGATVLYLYRYAIENGADFVFQTDSDGQTNPEEFWEMWGNRDAYDFQIGNRNHRQDGLGRIIVSNVLKLTVFLIFQIWVKDANTPFRLMKAERLYPIMHVIPEDFFLSNVAITAIAKKRNYRIGWMNITFKPRQGGANSINLRKIIRIGLSSIVDLYKINR